MAKARDTQTDEQTELGAADEQTRAARVGVDTLDAGNPNGSLVDSPWINGAVVGVTYVPPPPAATGANAGIPGSWTPSGATPPASPAALQAGNPERVTATPGTAWTTGQYVQTGTAGAAGRATWTGSAWVGGAAP